MKKTICIIHLLCISAVLFAQKHDNIWVLGYYGQSPHPDLGGIFLDFNQASLLIYDVDTGMDFNFTDASICDAQGKLLFYTNGIYIADATHEVPPDDMPNTQHVRSSVAHPVGRSRGFHRVTLPETWCACV